MEYNPRWITPMVSPLDVHAHDSANENKHRKEEYRRVFKFYNLFHCFVSPFAFDPVVEIQEMPKCTRHLPPFHL